VVVLGEKTNIYIYKEKSYAPPDILKHNKLHSV
jgi:hypothetical protein